MEWGGRALFSHGTTASRGVAMMFRKGFYCDILSYKADSDGRWLFCDIRWNDTNFCVCGVYAPNKDSPGFWNEVMSMSTSFNEKLILIGDFNTCLSDIDRTGPATSNNKLCTIAIKEAMETYALQDIWRAQNGETRRYSWYRTKPTLSASRLDYALVSLGLSGSVEQCFYMHGLMSDHSAMYLYLNCSTFSRGPGFWKFNNTLLNDILFIQKMNSVIQEKNIAAAALPPDEKWEYVKSAIIQHCKEYSADKADEKRLIIGQLTEKVTEMEENIHTLADKDTQLLERTKLDLQEKVEEKMYGTLFRSRAQWQCEGERNTKYFYNLERKRANAKCATNVFDSSGNLCKKKETILEAQRVFYQDLYTRDSEVHFEIENDTDIRISADNVAASEDEITQQELTAALKSLKNSKTPGPDGITADFYKVFWNQLSEIYTQAIKHGYQKNKMYRSAMRGVINMIPKPDKDTRYMCNMRPITLLNSDYKIVEKAIANRMLQGLQEVVHQDQKGFMPERRICVNIRRIFDLIDFTNQRSIPAIILSLDFSKCFDKIEFCALKGALCYFGCSEVIQKWTDILYTGFTVRVQNNGHFSTDIDLQRGVHQGGCASAMYFLYCAELLGIALRKDKNIQGIPVKEIAAILGQYADDMDNYSLYEQSSLNAIISRLQWFHENTGFTVNYDKTAIYRIGSLKESDAKLYCQKQIRWADSGTGINVLGVQVLHDENEQIRQNYKKITDKIKCTLSSWSKRNLSLVGKIEVINTLIGSLFTYKMQVLPNIPTKEIKEWENMFLNFIWNGSVPKIPIKILQLNRKDGGLGLINLVNKEKALKCGWIQIVKGDKLLESLFEENIGLGVGELIWKCNLSKKDIKQQTRVKSTFWADVLYAWSDLTYSEWTHKNHVIWYNSNIRIDGKPFFWKSMYERGLVFVEQLCKQDQFITYQEAEEMFDMTVMQYNSLLTAIPLDCGNKIKTAQTSNVQKFDYTNCLKEKHLTSKIYKELNTRDENFMLLKYVERWEKALKTPIEYSTFLQWINNIKLATGIPKYKSFQYRLLFFGLVTNAQLYHWKKRNDNRCTFCKEAKETIFHIYCECEIVFEFMEGVQIWSADVFKCQSYMCLDNTSIISNQFVEDQRHLYNTIGLVAKQFVYRQRCQNLPLSIEHFKTLIRQIQSAEKYYAVKNEQLAKHKKKWSPK